MIIYDHPVKDNGQFLLVVSQVSGRPSDLCCGIAVGSNEHVRKILAMATHLGGSLNASTCYLLERSLKTLALRVARQTVNAGRFPG